MESLFEVSLRGNWQKRRVKAAGWEEGFGKHWVETNSLERWRSGLEGEGAGCRTNDVGGPAADSSHRIRRYFITASRDMTARLFTLNPVEGFRPKTFAGHRDHVVGAYFSDDSRTVRLSGWFR